MGEQLDHVSLIIYQASLAFFTWHSEGSKSSKTRQFPNSACLTLAKENYIVKPRDSVARHYPKRVEKEKCEPVKLLL